MVSSSRDKSLVFQPFQFSGDVAWKQRRNSDSVQPRRRRASNRGHDQTRTIYSMARGCACDGSGNRVHAGKAHRGREGATKGARRAGEASGGNEAARHANEKGIGGDGRKSSVFEGGSKQ